MTIYSAQPEIHLRHRSTAKHWLASAFMRISFLLVVAIGGLAYVLQTSAMSTTGYEITAMQKQIQNLKQENQRLQFDIAAHGSMNSIQARLPSLQMVAADDVKYLSLPGGAVARR